MVYGKKLFSLALIFNSLVSIVYAIGILSGFYSSFPHWKPYHPYLFDANLLWLVILASVVNIFPAAYVGKVDTGRLWFHHYVYGFVVTLSSVIMIVLFTSVSLVNLFIIETTDIGINAGRFFILGGLTLFLDDLPDVSRITHKSLGWMKAKAFKARKFIHHLQFAMGFVSLYFSAAIALFVVNHPEWFTLANVIFIGTLSTTGLMSFACVKRKIWLSIEPD